jgi:hypothetical protein
MPEKVEGDAGIPPVGWDQIIAVHASGVPQLRLPGGDCVMFARAGHRLRPEDADVARRIGGSEEGVS